MDNKSIISTQLLQQVVDYLQARPYNEVKDLISGVVNGITPYTEPVEPKIKEKK